MSNDTVVSLAAPARVLDPLTELLRSGVRRLIEAAVSAEFEEYLSAFVQGKLPDGRQRVVRNGHLPERKILTGLGEVDVRVPKARSRSALRWCRRTFGAARASMRRSRGCTCTGCPPVRCVRPSPRWWANRAPAGCRRTWSVGSSAAGTRSTGSGAAGGSTTIGCTCGRTASTADFAATASGCACWWSLARAKAERAFDEWLERYDDKYPKATACLARYRDELLAFYDFPAAHAPSYDQRRAMVESGVRMS